VLGYWLLIMMNTTGMRITVLFLERFFARALRQIRRLAGFQRNQNAALRGQDSHPNACGHKSFPSSGRTAGCQ
jgi:hypothetical protein